MNKILLLLLLPFAVLAQQADTTKQEKERKFLPTGIRVGWDALSYGRGLYTKSFEGSEFNVDVEFYRYLLAVEYGNWSRKFTTDENLYTNDGNYYRVGVDVNFLKNDPDGNVFFIGGRYGHSTFSEELVVSKTFPVWGNLNETLNNNNINGRWFELTTGIKVKMWKFFWMGYTARFKFSLKTNETGNLLPHDVPGYGTTDRNSYWGFNYYLMARIPIRK